MEWHGKYHRSRNDDTVFEYLILPVDLIPDAIPMVGFSDDLAALVAVYVAMKRSITPAIEAQAKAKLAKWFPDYKEEDIDIQG